LNASDSRRCGEQAPNYPIIGDADFNVSKLYGMESARCTRCRRLMRQPSGVRAYS
jgi:alkyl hydroperoxide reductase subunit AhpC